MEPYVPRSRSGRSRRSQSGAWADDRAVQRRAHGGRVVQGHHGHGRLPAAHDGAGCAVYRGGCRRTAIANANVARLAAVAVLLARANRGLLAFAAFAACSETEGG